MDTRLLSEIQLRRFDAAFPQCRQRETWLSRYLNLRDAGTDHGTAVELVRAEMKEAGDRELADRLAGKIRLKLAQGGE